MGWGGCAWGGVASLGQKFPASPDSGPPSSLTYFNTWKGAMSTPGVFSEARASYQVHPRGWNGKQTPQDRVLPRTLARISDMLWLSV